MTCDVPPAPSDLQSPPPPPRFQSEKEKSEAKKAGKDGAAEEEVQEGAGEKRYRAVDPKQLNKWVLCCGGIERGFGL